MDFRIPEKFKINPKEFLDAKALTLIVLIIATVTVYLSFRNAPESSNTELTAPFITQDVPSLNVSESDIVCEYEDFLHEDIDMPDQDDDIQDIIGYQNNKVGLYIYAEVGEFIEIADELANSNGGDWGYVLIPYNVKDYNADRWGKLFERLSEAHLIPIIQLWDLDLEDVKKRDKQIQESAIFLNSLQWPIKNKYVSVYNEPNDSKFWKGKANPEEYAEILEKTINAFKALDSDFFMMNGALNASARSGGDYIDAAVFMQRMNNQVPGIFERLDGWASHPYPQPNFSGSPNGTGRDSIRAYDWELSILRRFNVDTSDLPVFITETGWAHRESEAASNGQRVPYTLNEHQVADNFKYAFENVWMPDPKVVAITPFTIRYDPPHDHFSWVTHDNNPYPQFNAVKDIEKVEGKPPVVTYTKSKILNCREN